MTQKSPLSQFGLPSPNLETQKDGSSKTGMVDFSHHLQQSKGEQLDPMEHFHGQNTFCMCNVTFLPHTEVKSASNAFSVPGRNCILGGILDWRGQG